MTSVEDFPPHVDLSSTIRLPRREGSATREEGSACPTPRSVLFDHSLFNKAEMEAYQKNWEKVIFGATAILFFVLAVFVGYSVYDLIQPYYGAVTGAVLVSLVLHRKTRLQSNLDKDVCRQRMERFATGDGRGGLASFFGKRLSFLPLVGYVSMQFVYLLGLNKVERRIRVKRSGEAGAAPGVEGPTGQSGEWTWRRERLVSSKTGRMFLRALAIAIVLLLSHYTVGLPVLAGVHVAVVFPVLTVFRLVYDADTFIVYGSRWWRGVIFFVIGAGLLFSDVFLSAWTVVNFVRAEGEKAKEIPQKKCNDVDNIPPSEYVSCLIKDVFIEKRSFPAILNRLMPRDRFGAKRLRETWDALIGSAKKNATADHTEWFNPSKEWLGYLLYCPILIADYCYSAFLFFAVLGFLLQLENTVLYYILEKLLVILQPRLGARHARMLEEDITTGIRTLLTSFWHMTWYHFTITFLAFKITDRSGASLAGVVSVCLTLFPFLAKFITPVTLYLLFTTAVWIGGAFLGFFDTSFSVFRWDWEVVYPFVLLAAAYLEYCDEWLLCVNRGYQRNQLSDGSGFEKLLLSPFVVTTSILLGLYRYGVRGVVVGPFIVLIAKVFYDNWNLVVAPPKAEETTAATERKEEEKDRQS
ncbi:hypothetical protein, conserved [Angomonas deanei]|uniref:Uncharacterized protein n=1 Tax=Angomonas deanei TaxID=59799 RepID=A0A7G2CMX5_9TRYP|nr:hypothetical protein, conserved [Angomonas deanei]